MGHMERMLPKVFQCVGVGKFGVKDKIIGAAGQIAANAGLLQSVDAQQRLRGGRQYLQGVVGLFRGGVVLPQFPEYNMAYHRGSSFPNLLRIGRKFKYLPYYTPEL